MVTRIKKFSILQTGKFLFVLYGVFSIAVFVPVFAIMLIVKPGEALGIPLIIIFYPLFGFIGGIIGAAIYNLASQVIGGLEITLEVTEEQNIQP